MSTEPDKIETVIELDVPSGYQENERVDVYITRFLPNVSRSKVQQGVKDGNVRINGKVVARPSQTLLAGDRISCTLMRPPPMEAVPEEIPLDIVHEDDDLIVVNKPAGMVVHPAYGNRQGTLVNALLHHVGAPAISLLDDDEEVLESDDEGEVGEAIGLSSGVDSSSENLDGRIRPGIVHRLDKDTSGLLVVAKNDAAHRHLAAQFFEKTTRRRYLAILVGTPREAEGRIETQIGRDRRDRKRMAVSSAAGKRAVTHYSVLESGGPVSLVEFRLETGRTHQIRVHAAHMGCPVLSDEAYGGTSLRGIGTERQFLRNLISMLPRQALHAALLGFIHPRTEESMEFEAGVPDDMKAVIARMRKVAAAQSMKDR